MRRMNDPINDAHVVAFHPGPDAGFRFPPSEQETPAQRLARLESEFLEMSIEAAVDRGGYDKRGKAVVIVALRAEVAASAAA